MDFTHEVTCSQLNQVNRSEPGDFYSSVWTKRPLVTKIETNFNFLILTQVCDQRFFVSFQTCQQSFLLNSKCCLCRLIRALSGAERVNLCSALWRTPSMTRILWTRGCCSFPRRPLRPNLPLLCTLIGSSRISSRITMTSWIKAAFKSLMSLLGDKTDSLLIPAKAREHWARTSNSMWENSVWKATISLH